MGVVDVSAGAGPDPYNTQAKVYMAGPYKGAPLSLAIITPATAGPFDLGTVVVRTALSIDPTTAQITATSDPIPSILEGIPLDVRSAQIKLDKPNFTLNGTSCTASSINGQLVSTLSQVASLSQRFQLGECGRLGFKPGLKLSLKGGTLRNGHPALTTVLSARSGDANIGKAQVTLPPSVQLDQSHIQAPCTRPQFAAGQCPDASVIGSVTATTARCSTTTSPARSTCAPATTRCQTSSWPCTARRPSRSRSTRSATIDTVNARLRTTFEGVPDAPITKAVIRLVGGSKGLLVNNTNLCKKVNRATVALDAHNNATADSTPKVALKCPKPRKHKKHHKRHHRRHHQRHAGR